MKYKAIIFDLDGVIVSTDTLHYKAWKQLADEEGIYFDTEINERLRGVSRMESLDIILERAEKKYTDEQKIDMAERKNGYYKELLGTLDKSAILDGAEEFIRKAKVLGMKVAIGSSSKNTPAILNQIQMTEVFDAIADGNDIKNSKPAPDVFLVAAQKLGIEAGKCLVVEDADAGVMAAKSAGMDVLAVGFASKNPDATYSADGLGDHRVNGIFEF